MKVQGGSDDWRRGPQPGVEKPGTPSDGEPRGRSVELFGSHLCGGFWNDLMDRTAQAECGWEEPGRILLASSMDLVPEGV